MRIEPETVADLKAFADSQNITLSPLLCRSVGEPHRELVGARQVVGQRGRGEPVAEHEIADPEVDTERGADAVRDRAVRGRAHDDGARRAQDLAPRLGSVDREAARRDDVRCVDEPGRELKGDRDAPAKQRHRMLTQARVTACCSRRSRRRRRAPRRPGGRGRCRHRR